MERRSLLFLLLVLPVAFWPGSTSYDALKLALWPGVCGLWALDLGRRLWTGQAGLISRRHVMAGAGLLVFLGLAGVAPAAARGPALRSALLICCWLATVVAVRRVGACPTWRPRLLAALTASAAVACLYGLAQMAGLLPGASIGSGMPVGISTLGNQNYLAGLAALLLWPSLALWWVKKGPWRALAVTGTLILAATVALGSATGPQVAAAAAGLLALAAVVLARLGQMEKLSLVWGAMLLAGVAIVLVMFFMVMAPKNISQASKSSTNPLQATFTANHGDIRRADWIIALEMFGRHPLTGVGLGGYATGWIPARARLAAEGRDAALPGSIPPSSWAHNEYLHGLAETGLLGAALALVLAGWGLVWGKRRYGQLPDGPGRRNFVLLSCGLATGAVHALVSFPGHLPASALAMAVLIGLLGASGGTEPPIQGRARPLLGAPLLLLGLLLMAASVREFAGDLELARGRTLYTRGRLPAAEEALTRGLGHTLWPVQGHLYRGLARMALGRTDAAATDLARSLQLDPTFEALNALAELRIEQGNLASADSLTTQVLQCRPYPVYRLQARFLQGLSRLRAQRYEEAGRLFTELLRDDPTNHRAHLALGYLAALQGRNDLARYHYGQALKMVDQALEMEEAPGRVLMLRQHRQAAVTALRSLGQSRDQP